MFSARQDSADGEGGNLCGAQREFEQQGDGRGDGDQQAAGGLRVVEESFYLRRDVGSERHGAGGELAVVLQAAGDLSLADGFQRAGERLDASVVNLDGDLASERHLARVADQAEAGDVGYRVHRTARSQGHGLRSLTVAARTLPSAVLLGEAHHHLARLPVERFHGLNRRRDAFLRRLPLFERGRDDAGAEALGQDQGVAGLGARVGQHARRVYGSGDGIAELDLLVGNAVPADHGATGLLHLRKTAEQYLLQRFNVALRGVRHNRERRERLAAHGVNVAQGVGRRDLAEGVRIVDDGREEVHRLHQRQGGAETIHSGVVGLVEADQHVFIFSLRQLAEHGVQNLWTELGRSARRFHRRRQVYLGGHRCLFDSNRSCRINLQIVGQSRRHSNSHRTTRANVGRHLTMFADRFPRTGSRQTFRQRLPQSFKEKLGVMPQEHILIHQKLDSVATDRNLSILARDFFPHIRDAVRHVFM